MLHPFAAPPRVLNRLLPAYWWQSSSSSILLTFDDGPTHQCQDKILAYLQKRGLKGLFFLVGANVRKNPGLVRELISAGHTVGNHTQNHHDVILCRRTKVVSEITECSNSLAEVTGEPPRYFRPPHGRFDWRTAGILKSLGLDGVLWSLLTCDFRGDLGYSSRLVHGLLRSNSIVTLHDNLKSAQTVIPLLDIILETADRRGFAVGSPAECLAAVQKNIRVN